MKILTLLVSLYMIFIPGEKNHSQDHNTNISVDIDPRTELLSIVCYLAGYEEYSKCGIKTYKDDVDKYFSRFKEHEAVQFAKKLHKTRSVGYNAPMSLAVYLTDSIKPGVSFNSLPPAIDKRFRIEDLQEFTKLLYSFSKETKFDSFFRKQKSIYGDKIIEYRNKVYSKVNLPWINSFFKSKEMNNFKIILSLLNWDHCYGASTIIDSQEEIYSIMALSSKFEFNILYESTIIHEFGHAYMNKIVDNNVDKIEESGKKLFKIYKEVNPQKQYSGWKVVMYETLVRSFVICYMKGNHNSRLVKQQIDFDKQQGFYWTGDIAGIMIKLQNSKSIEEMLPDILMVLNNYCDKHTSGQ